MTSEKQFREVKFSSTQLAGVFLAILILGIFIFLLGISVGKKQAQLSAEAGSKPALIAEKVGQKQALPTESVTTTILPQPQQQAPPSEAKAEGKPEEKKEAAAAKEKPGEKKPATEDNKPAEAKIEPANKTAAPAVKKQEGIFYVQIGAVTDKESAEAFAQEVDSLGFPSIVMLPPPSDKRIIYRIRIGPYETLKEAQEAQTKIATALKKKKTDFFIVKG